MWPIPQFPCDLITVTEEILNGKFYFLCSDKCKFPQTLKIANVTSVYKNGSRHDTKD